MSEGLASFISKAPQLRGADNYTEWYRAILGIAQLGGFANALQTGKNKVSSHDPYLAQDTVAQREMKACGLISCTVSPHIATELERHPSWIPSSGATTVLTATTAANQLAWLKFKYHNKDSVSLGTIQEALDSVVEELSDQNYAQSLAFYRLWFDIGHTHHQISSDQVFNAIWNNRAAGSMIDPENGKLIHSTAHLILRFASDIESDHILGPYSSGLQSRLCARSLQRFFNDNLWHTKNPGGTRVSFCPDVNLNARWANLGYMEEATIRNHILQSLISLPALYDHQADALIILFTLAGATFEAYADPLVVDRCFELLKHHYSDNKMKNQLVQVRASVVVKGNHRLTRILRR